MSTTQGWRWSSALMGGALSLLFCANLAAATKAATAPKVTEPAKEHNHQDQDKDDNQGKDDQDKDQEKEKDKDAQDKDSSDTEPQWYSVHWQTTIVSQDHNHFPSPYAGTNSLLTDDPLRTSETGTLFLGLRLGHFGEVIFDPEVAGGNGLSNVHGVAGFPNGEITRVGNPSPTPYVARLFYRYTCGLGGEQEKIADEANQIAGWQDVSRITISLGKMAATDLFDKNRYSNDPREQFLNWGLMFDGAWDYPADVRGYTIGGNIEWNEKYWAVRYGVFGEPSVANGVELDSHVIKANGHIWEVEWRYWLEDSPGRIRFLSYLNNAHMGSYRQSLEQMPVDPDITTTRAYRVKYGFGVNVEQQLAEDLGLFFRAGWNDGHTESWAFTEIDRTVALGFLLKGTAWCRPQDEVGLACVVNGISGDHRDYLAAGGLGFILSDGRLNYGPEEILETYYNWEMKKNLNITTDFQFVNHPGYNQDRGPTCVGAVRVHWDY